jgi:hypothetical protein
VLRHPGTLQPLEVDPAERDAAIRRSHPGEVSNVRTGQGPAPGNRVAIHEQVFHDKFDLGECGANGSCADLEGLDALGSFDDVREGAGLNGSAAIQNVLGEHSSRSKAAQ